MSQPITSKVEPDGLLVATIDMPGRTMNVFSAELMDALDALMQRAEDDPFVTAVVITSGKPTFLAGADLTMVRGYTDAARTASVDEMFQRCGRLGRQFVRLEASAKPWVAAVNGIALGGGLELAMACRARLVADDARIQLGTPEVRWGLLPGAGGTQRLPRLTGFSSALDLLLSGRSINPERAVALGVFARALPAAGLLGAACELARSLRGQIYDPAAKFANLAQTDVPSYDPIVAHDIARRHGVSDDDFTRYPAYSAIVDSVLKGARLPLAEANAVEMRQFLRLMFDPVAGRMIRTLFLERLRAERELAAPKRVAITGIVVGPAQEEVWNDACLKTKIPCNTDTSFPPDHAEIRTADAVVLPVACQALPSTNRPVPTAPLLVLSPNGPYGRILEIAGATREQLPLCKGLAKQLGALAWATPGPGSVLQQLHDRDLTTQSKMALRAAVRAGAGDPAFLDVAACLAGITPAWTGGPLTWLWHERATIVPTLDATLAAAWATIEPTLAKMYS